MKIKDLKGNVLLEIKGNTLKGKDFSNKILDYADLREKNLKGANFKNCSLIGADLGCSFLVNCNFNKAKMQNCSLEHSNCFEATFEGANLEGANIAYSSLIRANMFHACLRNTRADFANFAWADLECADVFRLVAPGAHFGSTYLKSANRGNIILDRYTSFIGGECPTEGQFIAWKRLYIEGTNQFFIGKLLIPETAKRVSFSHSAECRCSEAKLLEIQDVYGRTLDIKEGKDERGRKYVVGKTTWVMDFDDWQYGVKEDGIYFHVSRHRAEMY